MSLETRAMLVKELELRKQADGSERIEGYAAVYESRSLPINNKFVEIIKTGAFSESLKDPTTDLRALVEHDPTKILGRTSSGTMEVKEDRHGLFVSILPPDTTYANDLKKSIARGDVRGMSFGFRCQDDRWDMEGDVPVRSVIKASLVEVSPTGFPMYTDTDVAVRSCLDFVGKLQLGEFEMRSRRLRLMEAMLGHIQSTLR